MKHYYVSKYRTFMAIFGGVIAFIVALVYLNVLPQEVATTDGVQKIILTYGHSFCWFLLGVASLLWAITRNSILSQVLAYVALGAYIVFIGVLITA